MEYLPLKFNYVSGYFDCSDNELITLKGCPKIVNDGFYCQGNKLTSLKYSPQRVNGNFNCFNNNIMSLEYLSTSGIYYVSPFTRFTNNPIYTVVNTFIKKNNTEQLLEEFNEYDIIRGIQLYLID